LVVASEVKECACVHIILYTIGRVSHFPFTIRYAMFDRRALYIFYHLHYKAMTYLFLPILHLNYLQLLALQYALRSFHSTKKIPAEMVSRYGRHSETRILRKIETYESSLFISPTTQASILVGVRLRSRCTSMETHTFGNNRGRQNSQTSRPYAYRSGSIKRAPSPPIYYPVSSISPKTVIAKRRLHFLRALCGRRFV